MSYETQMTIAQTKIFIYLLIKKITLGELNYMRGHQPWHQRTCVSKLDCLIPIKSNPKLNNQTRS